MSFEQAKARALDRLTQDGELEGRVDEKVLPLLKLINDHPDLFTTSSCAGRAQLISVNGPGDKLSSHRWGIWHDPPSKEALVRCLEAWREAMENQEPQAGTEEALLYLQAQSPILHVACRDLDTAHRLRSLAVNCGWKYSSLRGVKGADPLAYDDEDDMGKRRPKRRIRKVMVELLCAERLDCALAKGDRLYVEGKALTFQLEIANATLEQAQGRLGVLQKGLREF